MMDPQETAENYDKLASHWAGENLDRRNGIKEHKLSFRFLDGKRGAALDVGCGSSGRLIQLMLDEGFDAEGLDISSEMIRLAQEKHPDVAFHLQNICEWETENKYLYVSAWDSVWHVPLEQQEEMLRKLASLLEVGGVLITTTCWVEKPDSGQNDFKGVPLYHAAIGIANMVNLFSEEGCTCRHLAYEPWPDHLFLVFQKLES